jgi:hypothetical protein
VFHVGAGGFRKCWRRNSGNSGHWGRPRRGMSRRVKAKAWCASRVPSSLSRRPRSRTRSTMAAARSSSCSTVPQSPEGLLDQAVTCCSQDLDFVSSDHVDHPWPRRPLVGAIEGPRSPGKSEWPEFPESIRSEFRNPLERRTAGDVVPWMSTPASLPQRFARLCASTLRLSIAPPRRRWSEELVCHVGTASDGSHSSVDEGLFRDPPVEVAFALRLR